MILSKRNPKIIEKFPDQRTEHSDKWSFTVIKRDYRSATGKSHIMCLAPLNCDISPNKGDLLRFESDQMAILPEKKNQIEDELKKLSNFNYSIVFFSSSKKINNIIPGFKKYFTGRKIVFCREISKLYEEYIRKNIDELETFNNKLKGELTIVISEKKEENTSQKLSESDINLIKKMINKLSTKEITDLISNNKNIPKKVVYNFCLKLKNEN